MRDCWIVLRIRLQWLWWDKEVRIVLCVQYMMLCICLGLVALAIIIGGNYVK